MNSENKPNESSESASSQNESNSCVTFANPIAITESASRNITSASSQVHRTPEMRRSAVRSLIQRYFYQLQSGCGNPDCANVNCASSGKVADMSPNDMAAKALQLFSQDAPLCDARPACDESVQPAADAPSDEQTVTETNALKETPTTSSTNLPSEEDIDMLSPNESSCSSSSTITSSSMTSTSASSPLTQSPNERQTYPHYYDAPMPLLELIAVEVMSQPKNGISNTSITSDTLTPTASIVENLNEKIIEELIAECKKFDNYDRLVKVLTEVFSSIDRLSQCFSKKQVDKAELSKINELLYKTPNELKKEDLRTLEGENDKDEDSTQPNEEQAQPEIDRNVQMDVSLEMDLNLEMIDVGNEEDVVMNVGAGSSSGLNECKSENKIDPNTAAIDVDFVKLRSIKRLIFSINNVMVVDMLNNSVIRIAESIKCGCANDWEKMLQSLVICFDLAATGSSSTMDLEYMECSMPKLCQAASGLPMNIQARLARIWAVHSYDKLKFLVECCQQLITLRVIVDEDNVRENMDIIAVTKVLKIIFYANLLASKLEMFPGSNISADTTLDELADADNAPGPSASNDAADEADEDDLYLYTSVLKPHMPKFAEDKLEKILKISGIECRKSLVPFEDFYNEPLSDAIQMHHDYLSYKNLSLGRDQSDEDSYFTFMLYAFILTPATKVIALYYDSRMRMYSERNSTLYSILNSLGDDFSTRPDLKLTVRRDNLIDDALIGLELVAMSNPKDLKKQLVVEFSGEVGIDEGGVSKEFFQLIVEEIFNPDFGMFVQQEETKNMWFNTTTFENDAQFTLIGIILGLAIYNNVILAVNFPMIVYRKLMGCRGTFWDLSDWNPTLYRSLKSLLDYKEQDMEDVFMQTFKISYSTVFGEVVEHDLIPNGGDVLVGQHNKQKFVELYCDYLLNKSVEQQFKAFKKGFEMVTDESPLKLLFRPEEIELLVCGSRKFDFVELEKSTEYEGGYSAETQIIKDFWTVVHSMPDESKRKLLEFTTGSDRIPVGGLSRLRLLITRHGPDSDRLPTSHTCFNVLLLPEYDSKEKMEERLLKAINYSKGFGML